jgi:tetratricopeptide (TPR) repeat protein
MYGLGLACSLTQQYEQQVWALKKAVQERPDFAEAYYQLGLGYSDLGYRRSAIKAFARAVQVKPDHAKAHFQLGLAYLSVNNEVLAHKQYKILKSVDRALAKKLMNLINGSASNTEDQT